MWNPNRTRRALAAACVSLTLGAASQAAGQLGPVEKVQLPALLSFDYAAALLGLAYGVDAASPLTAAGRIGVDGFEWATSASYLGQPLSWNAVGSYDPLTERIKWAGGGSYDGRPWDMSGELAWTSNATFQVRHVYAIDGLELAYTGTETGDPGWDDGQATLLDVVLAGGFIAAKAGGIEYEIKRSKTWFLGPKKKVDNVKVTVTGGTITENNLKIIDDKTKVGVEVKNLGGTIEIGGAEFHKTVKVTLTTPEPGSLALLATGAAALVVAVGRRRLRSC